METNRSEKTDIIINNILTRTSDRLFDNSRDIDPEILQTILHAGMAAPTAVNRQPWQFVLITNKSLLEQLAATLPYCHMANEAAAAIAVCGDKSRFLEGEDSQLWIQDVSAASENILLAAHAFGIGSVWTAVYPHTDRMGAVSEILSLPEDFIPFNIIPLGYVKTAHSPINKWNPAAVTYR
ncbi:MAG: nitroreductase family protein [Muribaculaceae bacterium]|nr:nitroreductase family protein [Muribaculaceae bacterium]